MKIDAITKIFFFKFEKMAKKENEKEISVDMKMYETAGKYLQNVTMKNEVKNKPVANEKQKIEKKENKIQKKQIDEQKCQHRLNSKLESTINLTEEEYVQDMKGEQLTYELRARGISCQGKVEEKRNALLTHIITYNEIGTKKITVISNEIQKEIKKKS